MSEVRTYSGSCHCGAVRFKVNTTLEQVLACNCSICSKSGYWLTFVPETNFKLLSGGDNLSDYQFAKKHIHHAFCKTCGVRSFAKGTSPDGVVMFAVNVRCLDDVDLTDITPAPFDGKSL